jgi:HPt (histidine-containing phosphotransfer) domain-containing protein
MRLALSHGDPSKGRLVYVIDSPIFSTLRDRPAFAALVREYAAGLPALVADVVGRLDADDLNQARKLAHRLKGSAGGYGFPDIARLAAEVEASAGAGDRATAARAAQTLRTLCERARAGAHVVDGGSSA